MCRQGSARFGLRMEVSTVGRLAQPGDKHDQTQRKYVRVKDLWHWDVSNATRNRVVFMKGKHRNCLSPAGQPSRIGPTQADARDGILTVVGLRTEGIRDRIICDGGAVKGRHPFEKLHWWTDRMRG